MALLAAFASAGEGSALLVGMLWVLALAGWALSMSSVRRSLVSLRQGLRAPGNTAAAWQQKMNAPGTWPCRTPV
jgi:hypothetical protein